MNDNAPIYVAMRNARPTMMATSRLGGSVYNAIPSNWAEIRALRDSCNRLMRGLTPDEMAREDNVWAAAGRPKAEVL